MKFDNILEYIGQFGPYQVRIYILVCLIGGPVAMNSMAQVFFGAASDHWCAVDEWDQEVKRCTDERNNGMMEDYLSCIHKYRNISIPVAVDDNGEVYYERCSKYEIYTNWSDYMIVNQTTLTTGCDVGWVYDRSMSTRTIITDFDLVCGKKSAASLAQSMFFFGVLMGSLIFGVVSDFVGRYYSFFFAVTAVSLLSLANAFVPSFWMYTLLRFFIGVVNNGSFILAFIIGTELVGPSMRNVAGIVIEMFFSCGYMLLAVLAYFIRDWRHLQLVIGAPTLLFLIAIPFVPESARWLISKKKFDKAEKIVLKAAKVNGKSDKLPPNFIQELQETDTSVSCEQGNGGVLEKTPTLIDLFRTPNLRTGTFILMYNWFINSVVYYGLSLSTSGLGANPYVAFFISGAVELPAYFLCIPAIESPLGRKYSISGFELIGGIACLVTIFLPLGAWRTTVAMVGKFGISASFALVYIYSAEVFPTPVRATGVGICSMSARVASMICPFILYLDDVWKPLPLLIFGSSAIIGGLLLLLLPETRGKPLPETMQDGETFFTKIESREREMSTRATGASDLGRTGGIYNYSYEA
ncbi:Organic cation transporter protein [Holothuria leucospilota]|uniref:Organic cation transporter protein n=1 Tax=Holothuria leucospilota TaxID=206669 RepID=A0A9Q0YRX9_HOLLE|nr:Organic cation transporter protein [Holothuria leucospilota]